MRDYKTGEYLAGFTDGEGCFRVYVDEKGRGSYAQISFSIEQRDDSARVLESLRETFGGSLFPATPRNGNPTLVWHVAAKRDILSLIEYFDVHSLEGKVEQYTVWREAAMLYYRYSQGHKGGAGNPRWLMDAMQAYAAKLTELKQYEKPSRGVAIEVDVVDNQESLFDDEVVPALRAVIT